MQAETTNILADAIKEYYGDYELEELCNQFNIEMDYLGVSPNHKKLASRTYTNSLEFGIKNGRITIPGGLLKTQDIEDTIRDLVLGSPGDDTRGWGPPFAIDPDEQDPGLVHGSLTERWSVWGPNGGHLAGPGRGYFYLSPAHAIRGAEPLQDQRAVVDQHAHQLPHEQRVALGRIW